MKSVFFVLYASYKSILTVPFSTKALIPSGVMAVFKPKGYSSANIVSKVKYILIDGEKQALGIPKGVKYKSKIKVGHGG